MSLDGWDQVFSEEDVQNAIGCLSYQIRTHHPSPEVPLVLVPILKGGLWTGYQLLNRLAAHMDQCPDIRIGHMGISSYGNKQISGPLKITHTLDLDNGDLHDSVVWLIDDIWHTGQTLQVAVDRIQAMNYDGQVRTATLVYRQAPTQLAGYTRSVCPDAYGLQYDGDAFLAGCGMGVGKNGEEHRQHSSIYAERYDEAGEASK